MPKYTYKCTSCNFSTQKFASIKDKMCECPKCQASMKRKMPSLKSPKVTETVDKYTNKKHMDDYENIIDERKKDYYWSVEVPKMVNSGIYELGTMLEQGWVFYNEKGEIEINTKPPEKQ